MNDSKLEIIESGPSRLREAKGYFAVRKRVIVEVARRYELEKLSLSFWSRIWLRVRIYRAVRAELNKEFPPAALHLGAPSPWVRPLSRVV